MIYLSRLDLPCNGLRASSCLISIAKYLRNYPDSFSLFREISPFDDPRLLRASPNIALALPA